MNKTKGYSLLELSVGVVLTLLILFMLVPNNRNQEKTLSTEGTAEELVARLRRARETARSKGIPVAIAIPTDATRAYSDTAFQLEGDTNPTATSLWKISQKTHETVLFTGEWPGIAWTQGPTQVESSYRFNLDEWWLGTPPPLQSYVFLPTGECVSTARLGQDEYRIVVAQGLAGSAGPLLQADNAWTVSIAPNGETSLERGVFGGATVVSTGNTLTPPGATYSPPPASANSAPFKGGPGGEGVYAFPDTNNPNGTGKIIDLHGVLTLEVRVKDTDGDPPYFEWYTKAARSPGPARTAYSDMSVWGGRFSNTGEVRMEWDADNNEWVGRTTWTPATGDQGGNSYQLECLIRDHKGGSLIAGFPVTGWLETTREQWVLYRTIGQSGNWELWKMTLSGTDHKKVVGFEGQDVIFGEWSPSGDEVIVAGPHGIFRAPTDGGNLKKISQFDFTPPATTYGVVGASITPRGDRVLYVVGEGRENFDVREITLDTGTEVDRKLHDFDNVIDWVKGLKVTEINNELWAIGTFHRRWPVLFGNENRRGVLVTNLNQGTNSDVDSNPFIGGHNDTLTASFHGYDSDAQVIWSNMDNRIRIEGLVVSGNHMTRVPHRVLQPGQAEISYPRLTYDGQGVVYTSGQGAASEIWYIENYIAGTPARRLPLSPSNSGGRDVSISIPR